MLLAKFFIFRPFFGGSGFFDRTSGVNFFRHGQCTGTCSFFSRTQMAIRDFYNWFFRCTYNWSRSLDFRWGYFHFHFLDVDTNQRLWATESGWTGQAQSIAPPDIGEAADAGLGDAGYGDAVCWPVAGGTDCAIKYSDCSVLLGRPIAEAVVTEPCTIADSEWAVLGADAAGDCWATFDDLVVFRVRVP